LYGAIAGHLAVGRYVLEIGDPAGALVRDASRGGGAKPRPRATPILLRPKSMRGLLERREIAVALSALDAGLPLEVTGEPGIGKTAFLRQLAHHPRAAAFADGVLYLSARHLPSLDLLQLIFEAFYEWDEIRQMTGAEIRHGLEQKHALILLDDLHLTQGELERVCDVAPRSAFVIATRARCVWSEGHTVTLKGLPPEESLLLLERAVERPIETAERAAAEHLCAALEGHPLRILQAAALARERGVSLDGWTRDISPDILLTALLASIDEKQRRALLASTALRGVPLAAQEISGLAEVTDLEPSLAALARQGLVVGSHGRYQLAEGVADRLRRREDLKPWVNRAITYFTAWAERHHRNPTLLLHESVALLQTQQHAADARRWGEVFRLGRILDGALVVGSRWGAWALALDRCLAGAKATGDRPAEAWALHQLGTRALCLGDAGLARTLLGQAVKLREALPDNGAAGASRGNLGFVVAPVPRPSPAASKTLVDDPFGPIDLDALPLRPPSPAVHAPARTSYGLLIVVLSAVVGWLAYLAVERGPGSLPFQRQPTAASAPVKSSPVEATDTAPSGPVLETATELPPLAIATPTSGAESSSILIFTARPGSIATPRSTQLCYAVSGAHQARIEPGVGDVHPTSTLTCRRVAPPRTTTYELTAYGRDGQHAKRQLVVVVR
jgi:NB-ARC domain